MVTRIKKYCKRHALNRLYLVFVLFFGFPSVAFAYLDAGIGSIIFQGLATGLLFVGVFWRYIKSTIQQFFQRDKDKDDDE